LAVFGSGAGTNLEALIEAKDESYSISAAFADRECRFLEIAKKNGIAPLLLPFDAYFEKRGHEDRKCPAARASYDQKILELIAPYSPDLIVLAGYMRILTPHFIASYRSRIINVHPADLAAHDEKGNRKYIGADGIKKALKDGARKTRSTVIIVDEEVDHGEIVTFGPWVEYTEGAPLTKEKIREHQNKQKRESDWPALIEAVRLFSNKGKPSCVAS